MPDQDSAPKQFFFKEGAPHKLVDSLPDAPPWRQFNEAARKERGEKFKPTDEAVEMVNAALLLRRPLLVTGKPGTGKSTLAYAVAHQLQLGKVLLWSITTRSTLQQGLYSYDAIGRLQDASLFKPKPGEPAEPPDAGRYIRLGPLGTAMLRGESDGESGFRPRVLLIDEIDKSDIDLPNDLLNIFEEGEFDIPELARLPDDRKYDTVEVLPHDGDTKVSIKRGKVRCDKFPFVIMTSNDEREFPAPFLRRCLRLDVKPPTEEELLAIVRQRLSPTDEHEKQFKSLTKEFWKLREENKRNLATDQLLNAVYLLQQGLDPLMRDRLREAILRSLSENQ